MIMVSPDLTRIYTTNIGSDSINIEAAGDQELERTAIPVGKGPEGFDVSPDGKQLWAAHSRDGGVSVIDIHTQRVVRTFSVETRRSNRLFGSCGAGSPAG